MKVVGVTPIRLLVELGMVPQPEGSLSDGDQRVYAVVEGTLVRGPYPENSAWAMDSWTAGQRDIPVEVRLELAGMAVEVAGDREPVQKSELLQARAEEILTLSPLEREKLRPG